MTTREPEQAEGAAGEDEEPTGRGPFVILFTVGAVVVWRVVAVFPEVAYVVVGVLGTVGWQKLTAWREGRHGAEQDEEAEQPDVGEALRRLVGDDKGVLLTVLRDDLALPDTKAVKALLAAEGIPWKASRTRAGNGPAVRAEAIPPAPSPVTDSHGNGCCCRSDGNSNSNNGATPAPREGLRVEAIGDSGKLVRRPADDAAHRPGCCHEEVNDQ
ncbi:hypothetical protein AB8A21_17530 [Streptomyces sp. BF23-18]|uniref:hypothetical protein n=1 Tax=Streptomyces sp. BF23-18 TaxID=3240282 RepID=UPI0034E50F94